MSNPGDIEIRTLEVDGKDLRDYLLAFSITESVLSNSVMINVKLNQQEALNFDLTSEGKAKLVFSSPDGEVRTYDNFKLDKISRQLNSNTFKNKMMHLKLIPEDALNNRANPGFQRSMVQKPVDELVTTFLNELKTKYDTNIGKSSQLRGKTNMQPFIAANRPVFGHIENLRKEAATENQGDEWLFYLAMNADGVLEYVFKKLSEIIDEAKGDVIKLTNLPNQAVNTFLGMLQDNIIRTNFFQDRDMLARAAQSGWEVSSVDMAKMNTTALDNPGNEDDVKKNIADKMRSGGRPNAKIESTKRSKNPMFWDSNETDQHNRGLNAPSGALSMADLLQGGVQVMIPLNTKIRPGSIVNLDLIEANEVQEAKHATQSGENFVIATHIFCGPITDNPRSTMILTCSNITPQNKSL